MAGLQTLDEFMSTSPPIGTIIIKPLGRGYGPVEGISKQLPSGGATGAINGKKAVELANSSINYLDQNGWMPNETRGIWIWGGVDWWSGPRFYQLRPTTVAGKAAFYLGFTLSTNKLSRICSKTWSSEEFKAAFYA